MLNATEMQRLSSPHRDPTGLSSRLPALQLAALTGVVLGLLMCCAAASLCTLLRPRHSQRARPRGGALAHASERQQRRRRGSKRGFEVVVTEPQTEAAPLDEAHPV